YGERWRTTLMRGWLVGGLFGMPAEYRFTHSYTPEPILLDGLRSLGIRAVRASHTSFEPSDDFDVVHVHHVGRGALRMAASNGNSAFIFTGHDGRMISAAGASAVRRASFGWIVNRCDVTIDISSVEAANVRA